MKDACGFSTFMEKSCGPDDVAECDWLIKCKGEKNTPRKRLIQRAGKREERRERKLGRKGRERRGALWAWKAWPCLGSSSVSFKSFCNSITPILLHLRHRRRTINCLSPQLLLTKGFPSQFNALSSSSDLYLLSFSTISFRNAMFTNFY